MQPVLVFHRWIFDAIFTSTCLWIFAAADPVAMSFEPVWLFAICAGVSVVAGWAALSKKDDATRRDILSYTLNMATCGAALSMLLYASIDLVLENKAGVEWWIIGVIGIASLSGMKLVDFVSELGVKLIERFTKTGPLDSKQSDSE